MAFFDEGKDYLDVPKVENGQDGELSIFMSNDNSPHQEQIQPAVKLVYKFKSCHQIHSP